jgi:hypothetical protein
MRPTRKNLETASQALAQLLVLIIGLTDEEIDKILDADAINTLDDDAWDILERGKGMKEEM